MTQHGQLDPTDLKIMAILQENARLDIVRIASRVHKSPTSTRDRIVKLQEQGYIQKYIAVLNRKLVGRPILMVTLVKLAAHTAQNLQGFYTAMNDLREVQVCLHLSGKYDFLLQVTLREPSEYQDFLDSKLCCLPMVAKIQSSLVLKECKLEAALPLFGLSP